MTTQIYNLPIQKYKDLLLNPNTREVLRGKKKIRLRKKEFELLEFFLQYPGRIFSRMMLLELVWGYQYDSFSNTVDVHISNLRQKLDGKFKNKLIKTVHSKGYLLSSD